MKKAATAIGSVLATTVLCTYTLGAGFAGAAEAGATDTVTADGASPLVGTADAQADGVTKNETVYVFMQADGTLKNVVVSDWLKNVDGASVISDESSLEGIENVEGREAYTTTPDGALLWAAGGKDIYYRGTTTTTPPVSMKVSYKLDGTPIAPADLAGRSGKVTIRFDYSNDSYTMRTVNGTPTKIYTPFVALTGLVLDNAQFSNVAVSGGKVINDGERSIVAGFALPGMQDDLGISKATVDIPDYVEITADTSSFELETSMTLVTTGLFDDVDSSGIDTSSLSGMVSQLQSAMAQLMDGSSSLYSGLVQIEQGGAAVDEGAQELAAGGLELAAGTGQLADQTAGLPESSAMLADGADTLIDGLSKLKGNSTSGLMFAAGTCSAIADALSGAAQTVGALVGYATTANDALDDAGRSLDNATESITSQTDALKVLKDSLTNQDDKDAVQAVIDGLDDAQDSVGDAQTSIGTAETNVDIVTGGLSGLQGNATSGLAYAAGATGQVADGLDKAVASIGDVQTKGTLMNGAAQLSGGLGQLKDKSSLLVQAIGKLDYGANKLSKGASKLSANTPTLAAGTKDAAAGAKALSDGISQFNDEAVNKIVAAYNGNLGELGDRVKAIHDSSMAYNSFSGISANESGSVKFLYETDAIEVKNA